MSDLEHLRGRVAENLEHAHESSRRAGEVAAELRRLAGADGALATSIESGYRRLCPAPDEA